MYKVLLTKESQKDYINIKKAALDHKVKKLLLLIQENPFKPPVKKLYGELKGFYSLRITIKHRLVFEVIEDLKIIKVLKMWTHYGDN
ncbi:addiction module antitoxin [Candidatus Phycorickettsia trachydisci]|uniref:Addiction module antitoxin n=1 Tax=Candidatus Phycorickettsia trachydisci TaxID=2115978 RepID=A0A2P1PAA8_9RICK|nr:Txe/YoeB family addiction module toxin [Candidatus Phycorickettsia trachydisci]AVP88198.1 addiction module antitoxin [Candidatus Phycorickettsia trachydisci]